MQGGGYVPSSGEQPHSVGYAVASGISEQPQGQNKFVEPRLRFERDIGRRRILEILRAVANDGRIFEHGQQGKAWQEHVEQLNQQEIFQIGGKGALKVGTAKEKFLEGLRAWKFVGAFDADQRHRASDISRQVLPFAEEASRKRSASVALDDFYLTPGLFDREEARSIAERKLAAEEKRAIAQEIRARAELMTSQAKMMERMLEARQQGIPVPEDFLARLMQ
ncbi:hypothetical protein GUITHDRAFT_166024 [Guillardia theta CCMP2712]|uniref:Uncharacterized protein n=1 Tax=Guillardia theta (strain CCMP2712) TaxID=905079 RepID=L1IHL0_GUITC|nr:hypothetical protein GUITHDRAFT_166024 [Guillardia theta CCMP2712]EKX35280.1 hypothetical protein GUITHDRAFT_166024 [Guillardia theta CCMP2712]|eukprot:XP_005822260.1 hypothetical protein GUITHDRAFT_166024 [Guillardia theta CCMP2712]